MPAPFVEQLLGLRNRREEKNPLKPNFCDGSNRPSEQIARHVLSALGITREVPLRSDESVGDLFEALVRRDLQDHLQLHRTDATWQVRTDATGLAEFAQYEHLGTLKRLVEEDETNTLAAAVGQDYEVAPDVTVGIEVDEGLPFLHASVSCKFTLRSDRAQNARTESAVLTRHRKGRMPHVVAITAEPLPSRIASLAQGTGDLDGVYHVALDALHQAVDTFGTRGQRELLEILISSDRLFDYDQLGPTIAR